MAAPVPPAPNADAPILDVSIIWKANEAAAPEAVRRAIDHLIKELNKYGLKESIGLQEGCNGNCSEFRLAME